jgi:hypothetical protein
MPKWLSSFGKGLVTVFDLVAKGEQKIEPLAESLLPASIPFFNVFDEGVEIAKDVEAAFTAAGQTAGNGLAKLEAALPGFRVALDQYAADKFPGYDVVKKTEQQLATEEQLLSAIVNWINTLPDSAQAKANARALVIVSAVRAALPAPAAPAK